MAIYKGFRLNPCRVLTSAKAMKECTAKMLKRTPYPSQCNSQAIPQSCFATGQLGPGSASAAKRICCSGEVSGGGELSMVEANDTPGRLT